MQVKRLFIAIAILLSLLLPSLSQAQGNRSIDFPDTALHAKIAEALGKRENATITAADMLELTELHAPDANIRNLTGIQRARNLKKLYLGGKYIEEERRNSYSNAVSDLSPIKGLTQLTHLDLSGNDVSNLSPLSGLTALRTLRLYKNPILDISPLAGLAQLADLEISGTPVSDISALKGLTQLNFLNLGNNAISDISAVKRLTQLTHLYLWNNSISDVSALKGLTQLVYLYLGGNAISDISALRGLTRLVDLYLGGNAISDISALRGLTQLRVLDLSNNAVLDVSPLVGLALRGTQWNSTGLYINRNPLNYASINTHIPTMQAKGVEVGFDKRVPTRLLKISGTAQEGVVNTALPLPFVIEVLDQEDRAFSGVPVKFAVAAGRGKLDAKTVRTDAMGSAAARLTLGRTVGTTTVRVTATDISQPVEFTATAILRSAPVMIPDANLRMKIMETLRKPLGETPTAADMLKLTTLTAKNVNILDLTGLQHAVNLTKLSLSNNRISNVSALAGLTRLTTLNLRNNRISDVLPLVGLAQLKGAKNWNDLYLQGNPLSDLSIDTHIRMLRAAGVNVRFDSVSTQQRPTVRFIYFLPRDRQPQPDINAKADRLIKEVQEFFKKQMQNYGLGRKTFQFETDANGNAVVYHINGKFDDVYYHDQSGIVWKEIDEQFDMSKNIYLTALDISTELIGIGSEEHTACGTGSGGTHSGSVLIPASGHCFDFTTTAHELGHAFGLQHDFRNGAYIMSYGSPRDRLSQCAAEWLHVHRAFNANQATANGSAAGKWPTIEMLPPSRSSSASAIRFRFKVDDSEGLHQVQLYTETLSGLAKGSLELVDYKRLSGNSDSTVEFVTTYLGPENKSVSLQVIDKSGNMSWSERYSIDVASLLPRSEVISIPDANLAAAIREEIGDSITTHTLLHLTQLYAPNQGITDLTGLEHAHNLRELSLRGEYVNREGRGNSNTVSDFTPLLALTNLRWLDLSGCSVSDIAFLAKLTQLTYLDLSGNPISNVSPLAALVELGVLHLRDTSISDISALSGLTQLSSLSISGTSVSDISPLAALTQLTQLDLPNNISDISPLADLPQLTRLHLWDSNISDISVLSGLTELTQLDLADSNISDISPLADLPQLTHLNLRNNNISDISALSGLTQLTSLNLASNEISDVSPLSGLTQLTYLYLDWNAISDISALSDMTQLTRLILAENTITDVSALSGLTQLIRLNLRHNSILDVSPLVGLDLPGTEWENTGLYIGRNPLSYASINTHIPTMQSNGVAVAFDDRTPTVLVKISGAGQQGVANTALSLPFVVEVRDERNRAFAGVPVTFTVTSGGGRLSAKTVKTDATGRAAARLTLGRTAGTTTVRAAAIEISRSVQFTATTVLLNSPVTVSDAALHAAIASALGKSANSNLTVSDMLKLTTLAANRADIRELTGLEHASNLTTLALNGNNLSDIGPLAGLSKLTTLSLNNNRISDVEPLAALTQLQTLFFGNNNLSDAMPLSGLTQLKILLLDNNRLADVSPFTGLSELQILLVSDNNLSDIAPLTSLKQLKTLGLKGNLLNYPSLHTHIPALQARGATVTVDPRTPTKLVKVSGTRGVAGGSLPVIVEVQDAQGFGFSGVPVTFTVTTGGGHLSASNVITDLAGKARTTVTFGATPGRNTIRATAVKIRQPAIFTITTIRANSPVTVPDVNLRAKIAEALNKPVSVQLTAGDMLTLTELEAPNANIRNLTGLEHAYNLRALHLDGEYVEGEGWINSNTISDFSPIAGLTQLTQLGLFFGSVSDVSFLSGLIQLQTLNLSHTALSDISALSGLTQLTVLDLSNTAISDVSPLAGLTQLSTLYLYNTSVSDITALSGLTELKAFGIVNTSVSDVSSLSGLTRLTYLHLGWNAISDISALSGLTQLTSLNLPGNEISDVSALSGLTQLTYLYLNWNTISDISALSDLILLKVLNLSRNSILDVSPLVGLDLPGTEWDSTGLYITDNPLSYASINTHIPAMQAKGVAVEFGFRKPTRLVKISGTTQQGVVNTALPFPFVVEVRDDQNQVFAGVPVTFSVATGGGKLSVTTVPTDAAGRASAHLTLGRTAGTTTVRVAVAEISQPVEFTATAVSLSAPVAVSDAALHAAIASALGKSANSDLTVSDMLKLTTLTANRADIRELTGLEHASNLTTLALNGNNLSDIAPLAGLSKLTTLFLNNNRISNVEPLAALAQLQTLSLENNNLVDVTPLSGLTQLETLSLGHNRLRNVSAFTGLSELRTLFLNNNDLSDIAPLTSLKQLKTLGLKGNLLNYPSLHTHIPALQARGATVTADLRIPTTLVKVSGTHGVAGGALPVIVEVQDAQGFGFSGVPVVFAVTAGGGHLSVSDVITDITGRARVTLTLGTTPGRNTIRATAVEVQQPVIFTITTIRANSPVTVPDVNLRAKIAEALNKPMSVQLTAGDMLTLTELEAPNANIRNLTGLEHAYNLRALHLDGEYVEGEGWINSNTISDFSPIAGLTQLTQLGLFFSSVSDVSFLSGLIQLQTLNLSHTALLDISALSGLTQLTVLDLSNTAISDVSPLAELTQLRSLYLYNTSVSNIAALSGLTKLKAFGIANTSVSDVSPLSGLTQLTYLHLGWNAISDISALSGLTQLTSLNLPGNEISDVSPLSGLTQLTYLHLDRNTISDISALSDLIQLKVLNLSRNSILDVSALVGLDLPGTEWDSTGLYIEQNPLNYASVHTHIPAMQAKGIEVQFDNRVHSALMKISGDTQEGEAGARLAIPFVVEALDPHGVVITGLPVRFRVIEGAGHLSSTTVLTDTDGRAETILTLGPSPGVIKIRVTAPQITYPVTFTAIATEVTRLATDVNGDGIVNIQDLVLVSSSFGQTGENAADVNGDGIVNIQDLVMVAGALGEGTAASPTLHASDLEGLTAAEIQELLTQARQMALTDPAYLRGIAVLEQLLALLLPKETALLPNYPNPFNPETWIPYQLAKPSEVTLHIYAVNGTLVRVLVLGYQPAGQYQTRSLAAYWDGRNSVGEAVASGVYFYTLTAGDFTATRKMLIRK